MVGAVASLAEVKVSAAFHVVSPQRQERNKACDELLLNDAGVEEATWREREREGEVDGETRISARFISSGDGRPGYYNFTFYSRCHDDIH